MPTLLSALERLRHVDLCELKSSLNWIANSRLVKDYVVSSSFISNNIVMMMVVVVVVVILAASDPDREYVTKNSKDSTYSVASKD